MVLYRRNRLPGGTYFFTVALRDRRATALVDHVGILRTAFRQIRQQRPFTIDAIVILPEHLHAVWTLPASDSDFSGRWRAIKSRFTCGLVDAGVRLSQNAKGEYELWQRRFWEHTLRDETDLQRHVDYIYFNPVKHGWVTRVRDWPYSSFHWYVRRGIYMPDWGDAGPGGEGEYGEP